MSITEGSKPTNHIPSGSKIYTVGNVGADAQVAHREHIQ